MNTQLSNLVDFQKMVGQKDFNRRIPTIEERKIRLRLKLEELTELAHAYGLLESFSSMLKTQIEDVEDYIAPMDELVDTEIYNEVEVLDALIDIQYLTLGSIVTSGLQEIADKSFDLVHENNMTKAHYEIGEADRTVDYYQSQGRGVDTELIEIGGRKIAVVKDSFGKILKPYNFKAVDLKQLL